MLSKIFRYPVLGGLTLALLLALPATSQSQTTPKTEGGSEPIDSRLAAAQQLAEDGKAEEARAAFKKLADGPDGGLALANYWVAMDILDSNRKERARAVGQAWDSYLGSGDAASTASPDMKALEEVGKKRLAEAKRYLEKSVENKPDYAPAIVRLGSIYLAEKQEQKALALYSGSVEKNPQLRYFLAGLYRSLGKEPEASEQATVARDHFKKLAVSEGAKLGAWVDWTNSEIFLANFEEAKRIAESGRQKFSRSVDTSELEHQLASLHLRDAGEALRKTPADLDAALAAIQLALKLTPNDRALLNYVNLVSQEFPASRERLAKLKKEATTASENVTAELLFSQALDATLEADYATAVPIYERALAIEGIKPNTAAHCLNNLAWCLAHMEPARHARALTLIEKALATPGLPPEDRLSFVSTRANIYLRSNDPEKAIRDFQRVFPLLPMDKRPAIHRKMALAYESLEKPQLARRQIELAERIETAAAAAKTKEEPGGTTPK